MGLFSFPAPRTLSRVTIEAHDLSPSGRDKLDARFQQAYRCHPAIITIDMSAVDCVEPEALSLFVRWQQVAERTGFHLLFVRARQYVYNVLRASNLDSLVSIER
jgi:ABC-type transporter Mla MlaB component